MKNFTSFPFGAVYLLEPEYSWTEVERDVRLMAEQGFNLVTLWPVANSWLPGNPADYQFADTLRFLDLCGQHQLKVVLQLIGQNPSQEFMPDCLVTPDMWVSAPNISWPNLNHPKVRAEIFRYLEACIVALKNHPAVYAWDVFNEANFRSDDPWTIAEYQRWLQRKYGTIEELNRRWQRRFSEFSQINPADRFAFYSAWSSLLPQVDYEAFRAANLTDICRSWCDHVRQLDPAHPVVVDGSTALLLEADVSIRNNDEFETATTCDIFGGTFYPKSWGRDLAQRPWDLLLYYGAPRAAAVKAGKPYFVSELQTHTQSLLTPGSEVSPDDLKLYIWTAIAAGGEAIQLWRWRPFLRGCQVSGRGLTKLNGELNPRAKAVKEMLGNLRANESVLACFRPCKADVTILLGYRSRLFHDALLRGAPNEHPRSVRGWHRLFTSYGLSVEVGSLEHLDDSDFASRVVVVPCAISLDARAVEWLAEYVRRGGCLIAEARLNSLDEHGVARSEGMPGARLSEVFGVVEAEVGPAGKFSWQGQSLAAPFMVQFLETKPGVEVLARDDCGHPMITLNRHGQGRAYYFSSVQGYAWSDGLEPEWLSVFRDTILSGLGLESHLVEKPELTVIRWHENESGQLAYLMNFSDQPAVLQFSTQAGRQIFQLAGEPGDVAGRVVVPPRDVSFVRWEIPALTPAGH